MSILNRLMTVARKPGAPAAGTQAAWAPSQGGTPSPGARRRELLRVVLREELRRNGIPAAWLTTEVLAKTSRNGEQGLHWRLVVRHWDERLVLHAVALQNLLKQRVTGMDPKASEWLMGISWQFAPIDESRCAPLPPPGTWTGTPDAGAPIGTRARPAPMPVLAPQPQEAESAEDREARADLERLLAIRDADLRRHAQADPSAAFPSQWESTEPGQPG